MGGAPALGEHSAAGGRGTGTVARVAGVAAMAGPARGSARALLAALLALPALLLAPARGRGGQDHGDWDAAALLPPLPPREDAARVARFVTHVCDWGALATTSTQEAVRGQPFADVLSLSDGPPGAGSGVPYFYLSPLQQSVGNLQVSMRAPRRGPACPLSPAPAQGRQRAHAGPCAPAPAGRTLLRPGRGSADQHPGVSHAPPQRGDAGETSLPSSPRRLGPRCVINWALFVQSFRGRGDRRGVKHFV